MSLAGRIVTRRKELGISQAELARRLGTTRGTVWGWESGRNRPDHSNFKRLAGVLETTRAYLLGETDEVDAGVAEGTPGAEGWGARPFDAEALRYRDDLLSRPLPDEDQAKPFQEQSLLHQLLRHDLQNHRAIKLASFRAAIMDIAYRLHMGQGPEEAYHQLVRLSDEIEWWSQVLGDRIRVRTDLEMLGPGDEG